MQWGIVILGGCLAGVLAFAIATMAIVRQKEQEIQRLRRQLYREYLTGLRDGKISEINRSKRD